MVFVKPLDSFRLTSKHLSEIDEDQIYSVEPGTDYMDAWMEPSNCTSTVWQYLILLMTDKEPTKFDYQIVHNCKSNEQ